MRRVFRSSSKTEPGVERISAQKKFFAAARVGDVETLSALIRVADINIVDEVCLHLKYFYCAVKSCVFLI